MGEQTKRSEAVPALVIIYNHRYDKNIEILEAVYGPRFSHIYHLMPFYDGEKANVIPVYEKSYCFQGYIAQGLQRYFQVEYPHYIFVADDLVLNPIIDEHNYSDHFHLQHGTSFVPKFLSLHDATPGWPWPRVREAVGYRLNTRAVEAVNELPSYDDALKAFRKFGLEIKPLRFGQVFSPSNVFDFFWQLLLRLTCCVTRKTYTLSYPLVGSYSDLVIVSAQCIKQFCHYCGVFAATDLFVELAVPTALVLSSLEIVTEDDLTLRGKPLWTQEDKKELLQFKQQLRSLLAGFPSHYLYLHPIKLSQWNVTL
jgi:hypothetical protein